jgi:hypothetical protein
MLQARKLPEEEKVTPKYLYSFTTSMIWPLIVKEHLFRLLLPNTIILVLDKFMLSFHVSMLQIEIVKT